MAHVPRRDKLALLYIDSATRSSSGEEQVRLAAEEGRDLQHIHSIGDRGAIFHLMDIGKHRQPCGFGHATQDAAAFRKARPTKAADRGAIGLVITGFEYIGDAEIAGDALDGVCHLARVSFALNNARPSDEKETAGANMNSADFKFFDHESYLTIKRCAIARLRNPSSWIRECDIGEFTLPDIGFHCSFYFHHSDRSSTPCTISVGIPGSGAQIFKSSTANTRSIGCRQACNARSNNPQ